MNTQTNSQKKPGELSPKTERFLQTHGVIWFVWALFCVLAVKRSAQDLFAGALPGNDDNMRMVEIRDWLNGQSWFDLHQYRLNPLAPLNSHWSRISDVLIGVPIKMLTPLFGAQNAEIIVVIAYPSILLLIFLYLLVAITKRLSPSMGVPIAAVFMAVLSFFVMAQFAPGRIDHHGLQIVMALGCLLFILRSQNAPKQMIGAGILAGLGLYVGIESALYVGAACIAVTLIWVFDEPQSEKRVRYFGLSLAATTVASLAISTTPTNWLTPHCDANSIVFTQLTLLIALAMLGYSFVGRSVKPPILRLCSAAILGGLALAITIALFPQCLKGPYAEVDPRLAELWLANVSEAGGVLKSFPKKVFVGVTALILPLFSALGYFIYHRKTNKGLALAPRTILIFLALTFLGGFIQIRLVSFSMALAIPFSVYLLITIFNSLKSINIKPVRWAAQAAAVLCISPVFIPLVASLIFPAEKSEPELDVKAKKAKKNLCLGVPALTALKSLGAKNAITQIDLGAPLLKHTDLKVSSAPYHRNASGNLAALDMFLGDEDNAKAIATKMQADYIIACRDFAETDLVLKKAPNGFLAHILTGKIPDWATQIPQPKYSGLLVLKLKD